MLLHYVHMLSGCDGECDEVGPHHTCILSAEDDDVFIQNKVMPVQNKYLTPLAVEPS